MEEMKSCSAGTRNKSELSVEIESNEVKSINTDKGVRFEVLFLDRNGNIHECSKMK